MPPHPSQSFGPTSADGNNAILAKAVLVKMTRGLDAVKDVRPQRQANAASLMFSSAARRAEHGYEDARTSDSATPFTSQANILGVLMRALLGAGSPR